VVEESDDSSVFPSEVTGYTRDSCSSLEPSYKDLSYVSLDLGPDYLREDQDLLGGGNSDKVEFVQPPKRLNTRNPPFQLEVDTVDQGYRANKDYRLRFVAFDHVDAFMFQGQAAKDKKSGNVTQVGKWTQTPAIAKTLSCNDDEDSMTAVVDKGRPIKIGNMTFTWQSPGEDVGPIRIVGSVVYKNAYVNIYARGGSGTGINGNIPYKSFPMSVSDCGKTRGCFRSCATSPNCPPEEVDYVVTMDTQKSDKSIGPNEILFKIGGKLSNRRENYLGIGLGKDYYEMKNTDIVTCSRSGNRIEGEHYLLEDVSGEPQLHRASIRLTSSGIDRETGFAWCSFVRPITPQDIYDLDLREDMHQFYLLGKWNKTLSAPSLPNEDFILRSYHRINVSEPYNNIEFVSAAAAGKTGSAYVDKSSAKSMSPTCSFKALSVLFITLQLFLLSE